MFRKFLNSRRFRYGSLSVSMTALVIASVIILNAIVTALGEEFRWFIDMTKEQIYDVSDECIDLLQSSIETVNAERAERGEEDAKVEIIFCDLPDNLAADSAQRYVYETCLQLEKRLDFISVSYVDIWTNPSAVQKYKTTSKTNISSSDVIVVSGTEFRVYTLNAFYVFNDETKTDVWAYNGEAKLATGIMSVIQTEAPIACITMNHSEAFYDFSLLMTLQDAGYIIKDINLAQDEIPEECRLLVVYNPTSDFLIKDNVSDISEIKKIDDFLLGANCGLMVFMGPDSPVLPNFEEYLEEWGIVYDRMTDNNGDVFNYMIKDTSNSLTSDGFTVVGEYANGGLGYSLLSELNKTTYTPKMIFKNTMSISFSDNYEMKYTQNTTDASQSYWYGSYYSNGVSRDIHQVITAGKNAVAMANGTTVATTSTSTGESISIVYTDTDGAKYYLRPETQTIVDSEGNALQTQVYEVENSGKKDVFVTKAGSLLEIVPDDVNNRLTIKVVKSEGTSSSAGVTEQIDQATELNDFKLMTMTRQSIVKDNDYVYSYVLACASLDFAKEDFLDSNIYGNKDLLLYATRAMGKELIPIGFKYKEFANSTIESITSAEANTYTAILVVVPAIVTFGLGIFIIVRRKYS